MRKKLRSGFEPATSAVRVNSVDSRGRFRFLPCFPFYSYVINVIINKHLGLGITYLLNSFLRIQESIPVVWIGRQGVMSIRKYLQAKVTHAEYILYLQRTQSLVELYSETSMANSFFLRDF